MTSLLGNQTRIIWLGCESWKIKSYNDWEKLMNERNYILSMLRAFVSEDGLTD